MSCCALVDVQRKIYKGSHMKAVWQPLNGVSGKICMDVLQAADKVPDSMFGTQELRELVDKMVAAMRDAPGVGLAAPQIGISIQARQCNLACFASTKIPKIFVHI